jgi:transcriptional regulator with XRE-family HTH domain
MCAPATTYRGVRRVGLPTKVQLHAGHVIRKLRRDAGFHRQGDLAKEAGVHPITVSRIETGKGLRTLDRATKDKIALALKTTWEDIERMVARTTIEAAQAIRIATVTEESATYVARKVEEDMAVLRARVEALERERALSATGHLSRIDKLLERLPPRKRAAAKRAIEKRAEQVIEEELKKSGA